MLNQHYHKGMVNRDLLKNFQPRVMTIVSELQILPEGIVEFLLGVTQGNLKKCTGILTLIVPDRAKALAMEKFILRIADMIDLKQITNGLKVDLSTASQKDHIDEELSKIKAGSSDPQLLFRIVDREGNGNGFIDLEEFQRLAIRMGVELSENCVLEIFSKVRGKQHQNISTGLSESEFTIAISYIQEKNISTALALLGVTAEQLTLVFIVRVVLLLLVLAFVYLGIQAFAIGGLFGAVVNSIFPVGNFSFEICFDLLNVNLISGRLGCWPAKVEE